MIDQSVRTEPITAKWNDIVLENFCIIPRVEMATSKFFQYSWTRTDYMQFIHPEVKGVGSWKLFYFNGKNEKPEGYAIGADYWGKEVYFAHFGCDHEWRELGGEECRSKGITHHGMFWHVVECQHCGKIEGYDSSG